MSSLTPADVNVFSGLIGVVSADNFNVKSAAEVEEATTSSAAAANSDQFWREDGLVPNWNSRFLDVNGVPLSEVIAPICAGTVEFAIGNDKKTEVSILCRKPLIYSSYILGCDSKTL